VELRRNFKIAKDEFFEEVGEWLAVRSEMFCYKNFHFAGVKAFLFSQ